MRSRFAPTVTPVALAHALALRGARGIAVLDPRWTGGWSAPWVTCEPDAVEGGACPPVEEPCPAGDPRADAPRWLGVVPYEAFRHLERPRWSRPEARPEPLVTRPRWQRYGAAVRFGPRELEVVGEGPAALALSEALVAVGGATIEAPTVPPGYFRACDAEAPELHAARVARALELIRAGDLYQVNLARLLRVSSEGAGLVEALGAYERLARRAAPPFGAFLDLDGVRVLSTSPELLLDASPPLGGRSVSQAGARRLVTEPIKGTRPRGACAEADAALALELDADPKERAELAMIIDVERNDLGRVAQTGSVRIALEPRVTTFSTVHHRLARVEALCRGGLGLNDVVAAMVPSGSVTGAPKVRAMEVIAELEAHRRGLYTGALGALTWGGRLTLAMAIRTLVLGADGGGEWHTGGGIVLGSDPWREVEETRWKAVQLAGLLDPLVAP